MVETELICKKSKPLCVCLERNNFKRILFKEPLLSVVVSGVLFQCFGFLYVLSA